MVLPLATTVALFTVIEPSLTKGAPPRIFVVPRIFVTVTLKEPTFNVSKLEYELTFSDELVMSSSIVPSSLPSESYALAVESEVNVITLTSAAVLPSISAKR